MLWFCICVSSDSGMGILSQPTNGVTHQMFAVSFVHRRERGRFVSSWGATHIATITRIHMLIFQYGTRLSETITSSSFHRVLCSQATNMLKITSDPTHQEQALQAFTNSPLNSLASRVSFLTDTVLCKNSFWCGRRYPNLISSCSKTHLCL